MFQAAYAYPMTDTAPFSTLPGGLTRFRAARPRRATDAGGRAITWHLRDRQTGKRVIARQSIVSDHAALYGDLVTDRPLAPDTVYETISVDVPVAQIVLARDVTAVPSAARLGLARGTQVMTLRGEVPVEALKTDDRVITRDRGMQPVLWLGRVTSAHANPVRLRAGVLKTARDLVVSGDTRVVVKGAAALQSYGVKECLVPARNLLDQTGVETAPEITDFFQVVTPKHEVIYAQASAVEGFCADASGVSVLDPHDRANLLSAVPGVEDNHRIQARCHVHPV